MFKPMKPLFSLPSNHSIVIKSAGSNQTSSDAGALLMRQVIDRTGIIEFLQDRLYDDRGPNRVKYSMFSSLGSRYEQHLPPFEPGCFHSLIWEVFLIIGSIIFVLHLCQDAPHIVPDRFPVTL